MSALTEAPGAPVVSTINHLRHLSEDDFAEFPQHEVMRVLVRWIEQSEAVDSHADAVALVQSCIRGAGGNTWSQKAFCHTERSVRQAVLQRLIARMPS